MTRGLTIRCLFAFALRFASSSSFLFASSSSRRFTSGSFSFAVSSRAFFRGFLFAFGFGSVMFASFFGGFLFVFFFGGFFFAFNGLFCGGFAPLGPCPCRLSPLACALAASSPFFSSSWFSSSLLSRRAVRGFFPFRRLLHASGPRLLRWIQLIPQSQPFPPVGCEDGWEDVFAAPQPANAPVPAIATRQQTATCKTPRLRTGSPSPTLARSHALERAISPHLPHLRRAHRSVTSSPLLRATCARGCPRPRATV